MEVEELSVFFPAYNEEKNIAATIEKAATVLRKLPLSKYEIIVINDGSKDRTGQILEQLSQKIAYLRIITHQSNKGYGEALKSGFYNAKYAWIVFTDSDGQFDFSEVKPFLEKADQADLIVGYRLERRDNWMRKFNGWAWTTLNNLLFGIKVRDLDCAFKLIKKEVIETIPHLQSSRGGMISPELLAKAKKAGFKIIEIGVHHYPRAHGQQSGATVKVILQSFIDLFCLWWKIRN